VTAGERLLEGHATVEPLLSFLYMAVKVDNSPSITAVYALEGLLAAVTLNRALIAVHFPASAAAGTH
jgi:hypothetical protein